MSSKLFIDWNLGLGDSIICNGLVRVLARQHGRFVIVPSYTHNLPSVRHMFSDDHNVCVVDVADAALYCDESVLSIGLNHPRWGTVTPFDRAFYEVRWRAV